MTTRSEIHPRTALPPGNSPGYH